MAIFNKDMVDLAGNNTLWQKEVYRDPKVQIVLMSIPAGLLGKAKDVVKDVLKR